MNKKGNICSYCGKTVDYLPYICRYCGKSFCLEHRLPERHECEGLEKWKRGELKKFKKPIKEMKTKKPFLEPHDWMPKPIRRMRINVWIVLIIIIIIILFLVWYSR